jgi:hypothetical protein
MLCISGLKCFLIPTHAFGRFGLQVAIPLSLGYNVADAAAVVCVEVVMNDDDDDAAFEQALGRADLSDAAHHSHASAMMALLLQDDAKDTSTSIIHARNPLRRCISCAPPLPLPPPLLLSLTYSPEWQRPLLRAFLHLHQTLCVFNPNGEICRHAEFNKPEINAIYCHMHQCRRSACRAALSVGAGWGMLVVGKIPAAAASVDELRDGRALGRASRLET